MRKDDDKVLKGSVKEEESNVKDAEVPMKVIPMPRPPPPFPQRLVKKTEDPGAFTIPCTVGSLHFTKALCDLGASINLMPLLIYKKLGLGDPKPAAMRLLMADRTVKRPLGILHDVLIKVESFIFLVDFLILDCEVDFEVPIILGRPFLATSRALVDMEKGKMKFQLNNEEATFNICRTMRQSGEIQ